MTTRVQPSRLQPPRVQALQAADRAAWKPLARSYKRCDETDTSDAECNAAWQRLLQAPRLVGLGAWRSCRNGARNCTHLGLQAGAPPRPLARGPQLQAA